MAQKARKNVEGLVTKPSMLHIRLSTSHKERLLKESKQSGMQMAEYARFVLVQHFKDLDREDREERMSRVGI